MINKIRVSKTGGGAVGAALSLSLSLAVSLSLSLSLSPFWLRQPSCQGDFFFFFFITLGLEMSDTKVYEP